MAITTASCLTFAVRMYRLTQAGAGQMGRGSALLCCFATGSCCCTRACLSNPAEAAAVAAAVAEAVAVVPIPVVVA